MNKKFIVIGAGLSGLNIAGKIKELGLGDVLVLEKSRGVGGRMATRRTLGTCFDHGAQFYKAKLEIEDLHKKWKQSGISQRWFVSPKGDHWCSNSGMTALSKAMKSDLDISLEKEIRTIHFENNCWKLISNNDEEWLCKNLIISSPLPQTIKLLEEVEKQQILNTEMLSVIKGINYTKALIALVTLEEDIIIDPTGYVEFQLGNFFAISDQKKKGVSNVPALTITMSPTFSEQEFDTSEEKILEKILNLFIKAYPEAKIKQAELKKWRYSQPKTYATKFFFDIAPNLFLIGDAFGGGSLLGAMRSSEALSHFLLEKKK